VLKKIGFGLSRDRGGSSTGDQRRPKDGSAAPAALPPQASPEAKGQPHSRQPDRAKPGFQNAVLALKPGPPEGPQARAVLSCIELIRRTWRRLVGEKRMEMHTPSKWTFWLSLALVVLAIVSELVNIPFVSNYALWVAVVGYVVLVIGCMVKTT